MVLQSLMDVNFKQRQQNTSPWSDHLPMILLLGNTQSAQACPGTGFQLQAVWPGNEGPAAPLPPFSWAVQCSEAPSLQNSCCSARPQSGWRQRPSGGQLACFPVSAGNVQAILGKHLVTSTEMPPVSSSATVCKIFLTNLTTCHYHHH